MSFNCGLKYKLPWQSLKRKEKKNPQYLYKADIKNYYGRPYQVLARQATYMINKIKNKYKNNKQHYIMIN